MDKQFVKQFDKQFDRLREMQTRVREAVKNFKIPVNVLNYRHPESDQQIKVQWP